MRSRFIVAAVGFVLAACAPKEPPKPANDPMLVKSMIETANKKYLAAMVAGDVAAAVSNYTDDAIVMQPGEPAWHGREAIAKGTSAMLAMGRLTQFEAMTEDVMVEGDVAIEVGNGSLQFTPTKGKPINDKVKYITVWKKQADGAWKIVRDINNTSLPPAK